MVKDKLEKSLLIKSGVCNIFFQALRIRRIVAASNEKCVLRKYFFSFKLNLRRFESRIHSCGIRLRPGCCISLFYIIFSFSVPQIAFSSWLPLAKACKQDFWPHTSESEILWLEVLQSLEGGAGAIGGHLARFKQTRSFGFFSETA